MDNGVIQTWLQLPAGSWPPDHYVLLGLQPGEADLVRIEQQVQERMEKIRRYQLSHPEVATEAMNRIAQAFVCLCDSKTKKAYDAEFFPGLAPEQKDVQVEPKKAEKYDPFAWLFNPIQAADGSAEGPRVLLDWEKAPPPIHQNWETAPPPEHFDWKLAPPPGRTNADASPSPAPNDTGASVEEPVESGAVGQPAASEAATVARHLTEERARLEAVARRGLKTKRGLFFRVGQTRQLLFAWEQAGKILNRPTRLANRPTEAAELIRSLQAIRDLLQTFPPLVGEAGRPGYLVLSLARQQMIVPTLQSLLPSQREALGRDWQAGHAILLTHRQFLRDELRATRKRNFMRHLLRTGWAALWAHPGVLLFAMGAAAANLAFHELRDMWSRQVLALGILISIRILWWWISLRPIRRPVAVPSPVQQRKANSTLRPKRPANSSRT